MKILLFLFPFFFGITFSQAETIFNLQDTISKRNTNDISYLVQELDEVLVSPSKFLESSREISKKVVSINRNTVELANPKTSADLLETTGNIFIQKSQLGGGSPIIRGFSTNRLVISIDGVRLNNAIYRGGNIHNVISISPMTIQNIEVILGSESVLYGSDAIGGVMNFYTKSPVLSETSNKKIKSNISSRYSTAASEKMYHFDIAYSTKKISFLSSITQSSFGDLRMGSNGPTDYLRENYVVTSYNDADEVVENSDSKIQKFTAYKQLNLMQKIFYQPNENLKFDFGIHFSKTNNIPRYDRLIIEDENDSFVFSEWYYGPQKWLLINNQITIDSKNKKIFDVLKIGTSFQNFEESRNSRKFSESNLNSRFESLDIISLNIDFLKKINYKSNIKYGVEFIHNGLESKGKSTDLINGFESLISTRYPNNSSLKSFGAYVNFKDKIIQNLFLHSGLRFTFSNLKADLSQNNDYFDFPFGNVSLKNSALVGGVGLSWLRNNNNIWKLNINTAFRSPNIDDLAKVFDSAPGNVLVPNPELEPERSLGFELGSYFKTSNNIELDFSSYLTYLYNGMIRGDFVLENGLTEIIYDGSLSQIQALQNSSRSLIYGLEIGMKWPLSQNLILKTQHNIITGYELNELPFSLPVRHIPPNYGNFHIVFKKGRLILDAFVNYNSEIPFKDLAESERAKAYLYAPDKNGNPYSPSWHTINLRTKYSFSENINCSLSFENISDKLYRPYSSGISAPGSNFIFSLNYVY